MATLFFLYKALCLPLLLLSSWNTANRTEGSEVLPQPSWWGSQREGIISPRCLHKVRSTQTAEKPGLF